MIKYAYNPNPKKSVKVFGSGLRISRKNSTIIGKEINGKSLDKGKKMLLDIISEKKSIGGKYYTNAAKEILNLLSSAENNADFKGLDPSKLHIHISAHKSFKFLRPRRFRLRGQKRKTCNLQVILEVR